MEKKINDLKKLPPEERIKRLKELEEKNKKEIEKAQKLIKQSEEEAVEKKEKLDKIPIPQLKAVDIDSLFTEEEKQIFGTKRYSGKKTEEKEETAEEETDLETTVEKEKPQISQQELQRQHEYHVKLSLEPAERIYSQIKEIYNDVRSAGDITEEQKNSLYNLNYAMQEKQKAMQSGEYKASSEDVQEMLGATKSIVKYIRGH